MNIPVRLHFKITVSKVLSYIYNSIILIRDSRAVSSLCVALHNAFIITNDDDNDDVNGNGIPLT